MNGRGDWQNTHKLDVKHFEHLYTEEGCRKLHGIYCYRSGARGTLITLCLSLEIRFQIRSEYLIP